MKYWEIITDNLKKAGEKQIASQTPEPWASASSEADYVIVVSNNGWRLDV